VTNIIIIIVVYEVEKDDEKSTKFGDRKTMIWREKSKKKYG